MGGAPIVTRTAYIALGSNLDSRWGTPEQTLHAAANCLGELGRVVAFSSIYETDPVGLHDQPVFLNAVAALETKLEAEPLLERMLALEREFGRNRRSSTHKGPRTLDLDLLLMDDLVIRTGGLTVPHPELARRRFVLAPLQEIAPDLRPPLLGRSISELLDLLPDEGENRISAVRRRADSPI